MTDIDILWENIFSEDERLVKLAWESLDKIERASVEKLLRQIAQDEERIEAQRIAARFALNALMPTVALPQGALEFARTLAKETGQFLKAAYGNTAHSLKRDGTIVTESDLESDRRISEAIYACYPDHAILSEERDKVYRGQEWCWVVDPIDGTTNFARGFPIWGVLIGLMRNGQPVMSVSDFPPLNEHYHAIRGGGAFLNDEPIRVDAAETLESTQLFATCTRAIEYGKPNLPTKFRIPGNTSYDLCLVASGVCVGALEIRSHLWDVAGSWVVVEEAGGCLKSNLVPPLFPLQPGCDYGKVKFSLIAASSNILLSEFEIRLQDRFMSKTL
jgi:myo-inositol-1(or 4)-monophosphatase